MEQNRGGKLPPIDKWKTMDPSNFTDANCHFALDPDIFFPHTKDKQENSRMIEEAKAYCHSCDWQMDCLIWGLKHDDQGIYGGATEQERKGLVISKFTLAGLRRRLFPKGSYDAAVQPQIEERKRKVQERRAALGKSAIFGR